MSQAETAAASGPAVTDGFGATQRRDAWWVGPLATGIGLAGFVIYSTFRAFWAIWFDTYHAGPGTGHIEDHAHLLSPFFSPLIIWDGMPAWLSPAFLILWAPGGFRLTCYYYRKAYYRAFFLDPVGCAVGEPSSFCGLRRGPAYKGETKLLLFQNLHRYFMYLAVLFLVVLAIDAVESCIWPTTDGGSEFGLSVGSLVLAANTMLLTLYTFSCHSLRHLVGGGLDCFSRAAFGRTRYKVWAVVSELNKHHMFWAWTSLFMVGFADFYVWMVASGRINDFRII